WTRLEQPRAQAPERPCRCMEHVLLAPLESDSGLASLGLREVHALLQAPLPPGSRARQRSTYRPVITNRREAAAVRSVILSPARPLLRGGPCRRSSARSSTAVARPGAELAPTRPREVPRR